MGKLSIKANVGRRPNRDCMNLKGDQITVMTLLNAIPETLGGTGGKLHPKIRAGYCSDELYNAIKYFQKINTAMDDGIVEPTGPAMVFLNSLAEAHLPLNLVGADAGGMLIRTASDIRDEAWKQVPKQYMGPSKTQRAADKAETDKWDALKARLQHDLGKSMFVKWALKFINAQEHMYGKKLGFGSWAVIFGGHVYIGEAGKQDWDEKFLMDGDVLLYDLEKKTVKVNNYGTNMDGPVILFGDLTYYVMKKYEIVDVTSAGAKSEMTMKP